MHVGDGNDGLDAEYQGALSYTGNKLCGRTVLSNVRSYCETVHIVADQHYFFLLEVSFDEVCGCLQLLCHFRLLQLVLLHFFDLFKGVE